MEIAVPTSVVSIVIAGSAGAILKHFWEVIFTKSKKIEESLSTPEVETMVKLAIANHHAMCPGRDIGRVEKSIDNVKASIESVGSDFKTAMLEMNKRIDAILLKE